MKAATLADGVTPLWHRGAVRSWLFFFLACGLPGALTAQPEGRAALSFAPGFLTAQKSVAYGIAAELETYHAPSLGLRFGGRISLRGDVYAFLTQNPEGPLRQNYQAHCGIVFNFSDLRGITPFAGFQPGFGLTLVENGGNTFHFYPSLSPLFGAHYFFDSQLHATLALRYVFGELGARDTGAVYLSEARAALSIGAFW